MELGTSGLETHFAPAKRTDRETLARLAAQALTDPVVKTVLEAVGGFLVVLDEHRQILAANREFLSGFGLGSGDRLTGQRLEEMNYFFIYPARHYVIPVEEQMAALATIQAELDERLPELGMIEAHRLKQRTLHDMEMIQETGSC